MGSYITTIRLWYAQYALVIIKALKCDRQLKLIYMVVQWLKVRMNKDLEMDARKLRIVHIA